MILKIYMPTGMSGSSLAHYLEPSVQRIKIFSLAIIFNSDTTYFKRTWQIIRCFKML